MPEIFDNDTIYGIKNDIFEIRSAIAKIETAIQSLEKRLEDSDFVTKDFLFEALVGEDA